MFLLVSISATYTGQNQTLLPTPCVFLISLYFHSSPGNSLCCPTTALWSHWVICSVCSCLALDLLQTLNWDILERTLWISCPYIHKPAFGSLIISCLKCYYLSLSYFSIIGSISASQPVLNNFTACIYLAAFTEYIPEPPGTHPVLRQEIFIIRETFNLKSN